MKRRWICMLLAVLVALSLAVSAFAVQYDNVDSYEKLQAAFAYSGEDEEVHITLSGNIDFAGKLEAQKGKTFYIDGKAYTLSDVYLGGEGAVEIAVKTVSSDTDNALVTKDSVSVKVRADISAQEDAVRAKDQSNVTVEGNITAGADGVYARDEASVTVTGTIRAEDDAVNAFDQTKVTVNGDIQAGEDGVDADDDAVVTIHGDIEADDGVVADEQAKVTVNGSITAQDDGVDAIEDSSVTVNGDITIVNPEVPDAEGNLPFFGNINDDPGAYSDAGGDGVYAADNATVKVSGNVTGGTGYGTWGYASDGVVARDNATVEVGGDVHGGDVIANPDLEPRNADNVSHAGEGVLMDATANVTVGDSVTGGSTNGKGGLAGSGAQIRLVLVPAEPETDGEEGETQEAPKAGSLTVGGTLQAGSAENGVHGAGISYEEENWDVLALEEAPPEQEPEMTKLVPKITVHTIVAPDGTLFTAVDDRKSEAENAKTAAALGAEVNYTIWTKQDERGTLRADKETAKAGETVNVTASAKDGYILDGVYFGETALKEENGVYSFQVPEGGDVLIHAAYHEAPKPEEPKPEETKPADPKPEETEKKPDSTQKDPGPKTGEQNLVPLYAALMLFGLSGAYVLLHIEKRAKHRR